MFSIVFFFHTNTPYLTFSMLMHLPFKVVLESGKIISIFSPTVTNKLYSCYTNIEHVNKYGYHNGIILKPVPLELSNLRANCEIENLSLYSNSQYVNNINYSVETGNTKEVFRTDSTTIITLSRNGKIRIKKGVFNFGKCKKTKTTID